MSTSIRLAISASFVVTLGLAATVAARQSGTGKAAAAPKGLVVQEKSIAVRQPGPHNGGGETTAFPFFEKEPGFKMAFRKRILHNGSTIGYHRQEFDEVYYVLSGTGEYTLNGVKHNVGPGTAMLTRTGDSHGIRPTGGEDLVMIIAYDLAPR
jgi:mannose-6-phosphate isomerase-like protein (cupin superfamily)